MKAWLLHCDVFLSQMRNLDDGDKFGAMIGALPTHIVAAIQEVLLNLPADRKFETLTNALKERFVHHDEEANYKTITEIKLGDRTPSELLREMKRLNNARDAKLPASVIRSMHLSKLPANIQSLVEALGDGKSDDEYGTLADKVFAREASAIGNHLESRTVGAIQKEAGLVTRVEFENALREIAELKGMMRQLLDTKNTLETPAKSRNEQRKGNLCYYHNRYGKSAQRCTAPCAWSTGNEPRGRW